MIGHPHTHTWWAQKKNRFVTIKKNDSFSARDLCTKLIKISSQLVPSDFNKFSLTLAMSHWWAIECLFLGYVNCQTKAEDMMMRMACNKYEFPLNVVKVQCERCSHVTFSTQFELVGGHIFFFLRLWWDKNEEGMDFFFLPRWHFFSMVCQFWGNLMRKLLWKVFHVL